MKHLLNGVAIAAALAIAGPVWAQQQSNPATPGAAGTGPAETPPAATSAMPPAQHMAPHHVMRHAHAMYRHHRQMAESARQSGDTTAALNREELARIQSGNVSTPVPAGPAGPGMQGPGMQGPGPGAPPPPGH